jgi:Fe-S-cluster containining protein
MKLTASPVIAVYRELLQQIDAWFVEAAARAPGIIPCRSGCTACCYGPFEISVADALLVREAVARLPEAEQEEIRSKAAQLAGKMRALEPGWNQAEGLSGIREESFDRACDALAAEPCPLLDRDGSCRIYADRPLICRMIGLGMITPSGRVIENGCPIAADFPSYATLPSQLFQLEEWEESEAACLEAASVVLFHSPLSADFETTIALTLCEE